MNLIPSFFRRRIEHRPNLVKIVDNIGWLFFDKILRMGVGLFVSVWIARYLGPEEFGLLNFATAFVALFGAIAGLGLRGIVVRDIVHDLASKEEILGTAAVLQFVGGLIAYAISLGVIFWLRPDDVLAKVLVAILGSMMLFKVSEVAVYWFESQVLSKYTVWVQNVSFLIFTAIKVVLILNQAPIIAFAWAAMAEALMAALLLGVMLGVKGPGLRRLQVTLTRAKSLIKDSWPLLFSGILVSINLKFDQIMITEIVGEEANGMYAVAAAIPQLIIGLLLLLEKSLYPTNIASFNGELCSLQQSLIKISTVSFYLSIIAAGLLFFGANRLINVIYGDSYSESAVLLKVLVWLLPLSALIRIQAQYYQIINKTIFIAYRQFFIACINVLLNWLLLPVYGAVGAAYAINISFSLAIILALMIDKDFKKIPIATLFKPNYSYFRLKK